MSLKKTLEKKQHKRRNYFCIAKQLLPAVLLLGAIGCVGSDPVEPPPPPEPVPENPYEGLSCEGPELLIYSALAGGQHASYMVAMFNHIFEREDGREYLHKAMAAEEVYIGELPSYPNPYPSIAALTQMMDDAFAAQAPDVEALLGCGPKNPADSMRDDLDKCGRQFVPAFDNKLQGIVTSSNTGFNPEFEAYYQTFVTSSSREEAFYEVAKEMFLKSRYGMRTLAITDQRGDASFLNSYDLLVFTYVSLLGRFQDEQAYISSQITPPADGAGYYDYNSVLDTASGRAAFIDERIGSAEHRRHLPVVVRDWLGLTYSYRRESNLTSLDIAKDTEVDLVLAELFTGNYSLADIFTANFTYVNEELAAEYGIADISGDEFVRVELPSGSAGIMQRLGAVGLSNQIIDTLLCDSYSDGLQASSQVDLASLAASDAGKKALASCFFEKYVFYINQSFSPNACEVADNVVTWRSEGASLKQLLRAPFLQSYFNQTLVF